MNPSFEIERSLLSPLSSCPLSSSGLTRGSGSDRDPRVKPEGDSIGGIVGIDEAGCGPWAGPVVVACVMFDPERYGEIQSLKLLNDSKKLSSSKREFAYSWIKHNSLHSIAAASAREIDRLNIAGATALATHRAFKRLFAQVRGENITAAIIDGIRNPKLPLPTHMIVNGDAKSCSIAAASILAKVTRDHLMTLLSRRYPGYGFERNAGYGTKLHQEGLRDHGITAHHRLSYAPIKKLLAQEAA